MTSGTRLLIKGGRIVNDDHSFEGDIYIEDGRIMHIESNLIVPNGTRIIDARDKLVLPGGIDSNTRLQSPGFGPTSVDDFLHGTEAAVSGGTTTIIDCCIPERGQSMLEAFDRWRSWSDGMTCCDYSFRVAVTWWSDQVKKEMEILTREKGVNTFLVFMAYESDYMLDDISLYLAFKHCRQLGALVEVHAENGFIIEQRAREFIAAGVTGPEGHLLSRPEDVEAEAVSRAIMFADEARVPLLITSITGKITADLIARNKRRGKVVFGESMLASLAVDGSNYFNGDWKRAAAQVTSPPLRKELDTPQHLIDLLANGDLHMVASSHCTFSLEQKAAGRNDFRKIPHGVNGIAERMSLTWEKTVSMGRMDPCRFVSVTSTAAAKLFNLYPKKGRVAVGSDADIVIWDANLAVRISASNQHSKCDFNIFEDMVCHGVPVYVIGRGRILFEDGQLLPSQGQGNYLPLICNAEFAYGKIWSSDKAKSMQSVLREPFPNTSLPEAHQGGGDTETKSSAASTLPGKTDPIDGFHPRPPTRAGFRHLQDSTFSLSGAQVDDEAAGKRTGTRGGQPSGSQITKLW